MDNDASGELDFKRLFESAPGLYLVLDPNLRIVAASDAYLQATLTRRADILGQDVFEAFPDPLADATGNSRASFNRVLQNCVVDTQSFERHDVRKPDSEGGGFEVRYWSAVNSPVLNPDGSLAHIIHRVENVTEFVQLKQQGIEQSRMTDELRERRLWQSEERFHALFESMTEGFALHEIVCDEAGRACDLRYLAVNPAFERHTGLKAREILGRTSLELFPNADPVWIERYGKVALTGEPARFEAWFGPLGRWFEVSAFRSEPGRFGTVLTDITARKRAEEQMAWLASFPERNANQIGRKSTRLNSSHLGISYAVFCL